MPVSHKEEVKVKDIAHILGEPFRKKRTFEEVADEVKDLIFKGLLKAGDKLPAESVLARQFNVGRQTIREALRLLEVTGFITIRAGISGGAVIVDTILESLTRSFLDTFRMGNITLDEITAVRLVVEKAVLSDVLNNASSADIDVLRQNVRRAKENTEGLESVQFHKLLARATKNQVFVILMELVMVVVANMVLRFPRDENYSKQVAALHGEIIDAIVDKRREDALLLLEKDLVTMNEHFRNFDRLMKDR